MRVFRDKVVPWMFIVLGVLAFGALMFGLRVDSQRVHDRERNLRQQSHEHNIKVCEAAGGVVILDSGLWFKTCLLP